PAALPFDRARLDGHDKRKSASAAVQAPLECGGCERVEPRGGMSKRIASTNAARFETSPVTYEQRNRIQRRTVLVLASATVLGGLGAGATLSVGALLLAEVSGNEAISGLASA